MSTNYNDFDFFSESHEYGQTLNSILAQELNGLTVTPTPVNVSQPPANVLVNRVPDGFTPILINLQRCSRAELRRFLHNMLCNNSNNNEGGEDNSTADSKTAFKEKPLGRCGCELLEFDYQPDFLFNKRKHNQDEQLDDGDNRCSVDECSDYDDDDDDNENDNDRACIGLQASIAGDSHDTFSDVGSDRTDCEEQKWRALEAERKKIKIKRPPNSFMIYRSERHNELVKEYKGGNKVVSGIIAKEWHSMNPEHKKKYEDLAAMKKREHELLYPNYKFMPKRRRV
ncbi:hypothetical protein GGI23_005512 [Coemansia sp. RSA 2559]|nr:hypothetical protein GGI23_005512 [Coemansia sp. RSA 2559]